MGTYQRWSDCAHKPDSFGTSRHRGLGDHRESRSADVWKDPCGRSLVCDDFDIRRGPSWRLRYALRRKNHGWPKLPADAR